MYAYTCMYTSISTAHLVPPLQEHQRGTIVCQGAHDHKHVEYLVAVPGEVEPPGLPPLRDSNHVEQRPDQVRQCHGWLVRQRDRPLWVAPVHHTGVHGRHDPEEPHRGEEHRPERPELPGGEGRGEQGGDGEHPHGRDAAEVDELPVGVALEDVVDGREEGGDDHDGDPHVVHPEQEEVEVVGVAREQVAGGAREETEHGTP